MTGLGQERERPQRQDSLTDQMAGLVKHAELEGMYDAADWIKARFKPLGAAEPWMVPLSGLPRSAEPKGDG